MFINKKNMYFVLKIKMQSGAELKMSLEMNSSVACAKNVDDSVVLSTS
jgi:hypothetical protein